MNPMTAMPLLSILPGNAEAMPAGVGDKLPGSDFGTFLVDLGLQVPGPATTPAAPVPTLPAALAADPALAAPANPLPHPGRILPVAASIAASHGLPVVNEAAELALTDPAAQPDPDWAPASPTQALPRLQPTTAPRPRAQLAEQTPETEPEAAEPSPDTAESPDTPTAPAVAVLVAPSVVIVPAPLALQTAPQVASATPESEMRPTAQAAPTSLRAQTAAAVPLSEAAPTPHRDRAVAAAVPVQLQPALAAPTPRTAVRVTIDPVPLAPTVVQTEAPPRTPPAATPASVATLIAAMDIPARPRPAMRQIPLAESLPTPQAVMAGETAQLTEPRPLTVPHAPLDLLAAPLQLTDVPLAQSLASPPVLTQSQVEPRDFTALLDRLVAAREAMRGEQTRVSMALPHAEFGQVRLDFRHDREGLSVAMASSDPAFARAASAALPLAAAPASAETGARPGSDNNPRWQGETQGSGGGAAQSRGGGGERQHERTPLRQTVTASRNGQREGKDKQGIFA